jgi:cytochrome b
VFLNKVRVWDLPTRLFHWCLAFCFGCLIITGEVGGEAMVWHFRLGYCVLSLLGFRIVWGLVGGYWSRFRVFVVGPDTILRYLRGDAAAESAVGHNPMGALSVLGLLGFALLQAATGLMSDDEILNAGPLAKMVSGRWVHWATEYHIEVGKGILISLVVLHLCAIVFYRFRRDQNLVGPMLHGDKWLETSVKSSRDDAVSRVQALVAFAVCSAAVAWLVQWAG